MSVTSKLPNRKVLYKSTQNLKPKCSDLTSNGMPHYCLHCLITLQGKPWCLMNFWNVGVGKWVTASAGKAKGRYGSFRQRMNSGCAGKTVRSLENACHTRAPRGVITTRCYTNPRLPYLILCKLVLVTVQQCTECGNVQRQLCAVVCMTAFDLWDWWQHACWCKISVHVYRSENYSNVSGHVMQPVPWFTDAGQKRLTSRV